MPYKPPQIPNIPKALKRFQKIAWTVTSAMVLDFVEDERQRFIRRIKRQDFESFRILPLSPRWLKKKIAAGVDDRVMIATGHYLRSIKVFTKAHRDTLLDIRIGFDRRTLARDFKGHTIPFALYKVATVQEKGSVKAKVPARPHWEPHKKDMKVRAKPYRLKIKSKIRRETLKQVGSPIRS